MSKYFISLLFLGLPFWGICQDEPVDLQPKDTVEYKQQYGLRVGADLNRLVFSFLDENYTGFEVAGDFRLTQKLYLGGELGNEEKTLFEDLGNTPLYNYTSKGSYIKLGVDLNTYENWFGMENSIIIGGRYSFATFSQTLNDYKIYDSDRFFIQDDFLNGTTPGQEFSGLSASWLEFIVGIKAELFANIYVGMSARLGFLITNTDDDQFPNLWIPGFNRVTDGSNFGVSYNYTLSYLIPFYKKSKKQKDQTEE